MKKPVLLSKTIIFIFSIFIFFGIHLSVSATTLEAVDESEDETVQVTVGQDEDGNVTVTYDDHVFTRKYNGWYIPSAYIYDGSDLDNYLDSRVVYTRRTSVRYDGFLFIKMSGGWYRHELHINDGRALATVFNEAAGITSTYNPNNLTELPNGQPEATN